MGQGLSAVTPRWVGTIVVEGCHHPVSIACASASGNIVVFEVASLPDDASPPDTRCAAFAVPLTMSLGELMPLLVQAITGRPATATPVLGVGAIVPPRHGCHAVVVEMATDPDSADERQSLVATIRIADDPQSERFIWTDEISLGDWLTQVDLFCQRHRDWLIEDWRDAALQAARCRSGGDERDLAGWDRQS